MKKDLTYYRRRAREQLAHLCGVYPVCNGDPDHLCTGQKYGAPIGLGGAGQAKTFEANFKALQQYRLKMRVIKAHREPEMSTSLFGKELTAPVMGAALSGVNKRAHRSVYCVRRSDTLDSKSNHRSLRLYQELSPCISPRVGYNARLYVILALMTALAKTSARCSAQKSGRLLNRSSASFELTAARVSCAAAHTLPEF